MPNEQPPPPPPPVEGEGKAPEGSSFFEWMKDVMCGPYTDKVKESAIENAYKERLR